MKVKIDEILNENDERNDSSNSLEQTNNDVDTIRAMSEELSSVNDEEVTFTEEEISEANSLNQSSSDIEIASVVSEESQSESGEETSSAEESSENKDEDNSKESLDNTETETENDGPVFEEVIVKKTAREIRNESYYDGTLLETIGWKLLGGFLTGITLTLGKPWADCMVLRYKVNHTVLNGKRLKFEGTGGELFVERFKWIFLTIITLTIYAWFIPMKKKKWILSHIHFEDEPLVKGESYFDGKLIQLIGINILSNILNVLSFGILYPLTNCMKLKWLAKHSIINKKRIVFDGKALSLWGHYLLWMLLTLVTFGIYGLWIGIKMQKWTVKNSHIKLAGEKEVKSNNLVLILISLVCAVFGALLMFRFVIPFVATWTFNLSTILVNNEVNIPLEEPTRPVRTR